jgi:hypothetical protein
MSLLAVKGAIDDIACVRERRRQLAIQVRIVLDHEQAHVSLPALSGDKDAERG